MTAVQGTYLDEISCIKKNIEKFKSTIGQIILNDQSLNYVSDRQYKEHLEKLDGITSESKEVRKKIKESLKELGSYKLPEPQQENVRHGQYVTLKKQFMDSISNYQKAEQKHHQQVKARMERQYRIVRPNATDEEVKEAIDIDSALFSQSVLHSTQIGEAKGALREVQDRHMDIQKIVKNIEELNSLYHELQYMVESQDMLVNNIEKEADDANNQLREVNAELEEAFELAKNARKKKWLLALLISSILAVIIVIIGYYIFFT